MKKFIATFVLIFLVVPWFAMAANPCSGGSGDVTQLPRCINQIYIWSLGVAALLALLMMVIGGYSYMTASGNAEQSAKGVEMIWSSIIGIALLFGAYLLLNTINPDLVKFNLTRGMCLDVAGKTTTATEAQCISPNKWYSVFDNGTTTPAPTAPRTP